MSTVQLVILIALTIFIIWYSWYASIKDKRYHGIYRFFSFESIIVLALLNYRVWFRNPFSIIQIASWILLILSIIMGVAGFQNLSKKGEAQGKIENTTRLITTGIYKYIRHPLYLSLLFLGTGAVLKNPGTAQIILGIINLIALYLTARVEEKEMILKFGDEYNNYKKHSKMFIPFIF